MWPVEAVPSAPLPLGGPTTLAGNLVWEGVVEEEVQVSRDVGVEEACVHPPLYLATKISLGVPPYLLNFQKFLGP